MRILRFRCTGCGLEMAMADKPEKCFCCGSTEIVREGWRARFMKNRERDRSAKK